MSVFKLKNAVYGLLVTATTLFSSSALADYTLNMRKGVTVVSNTAYHLHMIVLTICVIVGIGVFGMIFYSMLNHRKSKGAVAATFHENHKLEVVWTVIPFLILVGLAIPATKALLQVEDASNSDMSIKVTGYQWKWHYDYMGEGVGFFSALDAKSTEYSALHANKNVNDVQNYLLNVDNPLVIPVGKKVRFLITSTDVIHSWWVPDFGFKKDAIPGYVNEAWTRVDEPGTYRGQCAELCGKGHGFMPIVVIAKEEKDYEKWLADQKAAAAAEAAAAASNKVWSKDELMARGEKIYLANCVACHQATGKGLPGVFPALAGSKIATGPAEGHIDIVVHGSKKNPAMVAFGKQLNDVELASVITYERNSWGNSAGIVQPKDVKAQR